MPLLFQLILPFSELLGDDDITIPLNVILEIYVKLFGYESSDELLTDTAFRAESLRISFLLYEPRRIYQGTSINI